MQRTITVKGIGKASARPDLIVISMSLETRDRQYDEAMNLAAENNQKLTDAFVAIGFKKEDVKTTSFNVRTEYQSVKDRNGNYRQEFIGFLVSHSLKIEFALDVPRLSAVLSAAVACRSNPQIGIAFTVKNATALNEEMLRSATANAKRKAEILCEAAGVSLGGLISIDYNWGELDIRSDTRYSMADECFAAPMEAKSIEIEPDDIDVSDTATFVWEIKQEA